MMRAMNLCKFHFENKLRICFLQNWMAKRVPSSHFLLMRAFPCEKLDSLLGKHQRPREFITKVNS